MTEKNALTEQLKSFIEKTGKNATALSSLAKASSQLPLLKDIGIRPMSKTAFIIETLTPYLGDALLFVKTGRGTYLVLNKPEDEFLLKAINPEGSSTKDLTGRLPTAKKEHVLSIINELLKACKIRVGRVNKDFKAMSFFVVHQTTPQPGAEKAAAQDPVTEEVFFKVLDELITRSGKSQARISKMRDLLGWEDKDFDRIVNVMLGHKKIQLYSDYIGTLTMEERDRAFMDSNGKPKYDISRW